jgi:hypothetical protein
MTTKSRRKSKYKEKIYSYELWKLLQKFRKYQKRTIEKTRIKLKWNDYNLIRKMFPHDTTHSIEIISGIQLNASEPQFPGGLCSLMLDFQEAADNPVNYFIKKVLPKLAKKHLGVREKIKIIEEYELKVPMRTCPIFIQNYLEEFILTLSLFTKFGDPIYLTDIPAYHFFLNATHNCSYYLGKTKEVENFSKYEAFIEELLDPSIVPDEIEEVDVIPIYKLGQGKVIFIKAEDFGNTYYLIMLTVKVRIFRKPNQYQYHYVKALEKMF